MLTAMTLALPRRTNVPRSMKKDPKDIPDRAFKNIECSITFGTEGVLLYSTLGMNHTVVHTSTGTPL
jgi:hypothetical protein